MKCIKEQTVNINFLIDVLYNVSPYVLPKANGAPKKTIYFLDTLFPQSILDHPDMFNVWSNASRLSKIINRSERQPGPKLVKTIITLLNEDKSIIHDMYEKVSNFFTTYGGSYPYLRELIVDENNEFIDKAVIGNRYAKLIEDSNCGAFVITVLILFAILGENINALDFDWESINAVNESHSKDEYIDFLQKYLDGYINSILSCDVKWGRCTNDTVNQSANTSEGLSAMIYSGKYKIYSDLFNSILEEFSQSVTDKGMISKSLGFPTTVSTSMFLEVWGKIDNTKYTDLAKYLWSVHTEKGWGVYTIPLANYENISCTFWALKALKLYPEIANSDEFRKFVRSLYTRENTYCYGTTIDICNPKVPALHTTAMMLITYLEMSQEDKELIGTRYDYKKAVEFLLDNFDNPYTLTENEVLEGVDTIPNVEIKRIPWTHLSIRYAIEALSVAIKNGLLYDSQTSILLSKVQDVIADYTSIEDSNYYWHSPTGSSVQGARGRNIFPTMHIIISASLLLSVLKKD